MNQDKIAHGYLSGIVTAWDGTHYALGIRLVLDHEGETLFIRKALSHPFVADGNDWLVLKTEVVKEIDDSMVGLGEIQKY